MRQAKDDFLLAGERYAGEGTRLSRATVEQLQPYYDRSEGRAAVIQRFAEDLADAIGDFDRVQPMLTELVAMLLLQTSERGAVAGAEAIAAVGRQVLGAGSAPGDPGLSDRDLKSLGDLVALKDLAERIENEAAVAVEVSAALYALREDELRQYLAGVPHVSKMSVLKTLPAVVAKEGTLQAVGAGLQALAKLAGTQVPVANAVMGVYQAGKDLRDKVLAMEAHYKRSPIDSMFELAERIDDQQQVHKAAIDLLVLTRQAIAEA